MELSVPTRKRLWQQIVRAKIKAQGELLRELHGSDQGLIALSARVRSGDQGNLEAQAARRYWQHLFPGKPFRRGSDEVDQNRHLDYGYTVLRAAVARALCAAGLHPSIGLQHSNRYNPFCLSADVMEPFRPLIDRCVAQWIAREDAGAPLDSRAKSWLIGAVTARYIYEREERTLFDILLRVANSLAKCITGEQRDLVMPTLLEAIPVEPAVKRGVKRAEPEELWALKANG
jgi:CRISPR-associated protein Cas1